MACIKLGLWLLRTFFFSPPDRQKSNIGPDVQRYFRLLLVPCLLASHGPKKVTWASPKPRQGSTVVLP